MPPIIATAPVIETLRRILDSSRRPAAARMAAAVALVLGPLGLLVGSLIGPRGEEGAAAQLALAAHFDRWVPSVVIALPSFVLLVVAVLGIGDLVRERATLLGHAGAALVLAGLFGMAVAFVAPDLTIWQMARQPHRPEMVALLQRLNGSTAFAVPRAMTRAFPLGFVVLALALHRARASSAWVAVAVALGPLLWFFAYPNRIVTTSGQVLFLVGLAAVGWRLATVARAEAPARSPTPEERRQAATLA